MYFFEDYCVGLEEVSNNFRNVLEKFCTFLGLVGLER